MRRLLVGVVAVVAAAVAANVATAGTITVGPGCTLADAITAANTDAATGGCAAGSGDDAIVLAPGGVYTLTAVADTVDGPNGLPTVTSPITVLGNGATIERSAATGTPEFRIFNVKRLPLGDDPSLRLEGLTLRGGLVRSAYPFSPVCAGGGALHARGAIVELDRVTIAGSEVLEPAPGLDCFAAGGGIEVSSGTLVVTDSAIRDNRAANGGGGIHALVTATTIVSTTVDGNRAENPAGLQADGGGVLARGGDTLIRRSTISDNVAGHGGGIAVDTELSTIANTTISGNRAEVGGGIVSNSGLALLNATVAGNAADAAGGLWIANPQMVVRNTIIAGNTAAGDPARPNADCATAENEPLAGDHNLFGLGTGCHTAGDTLVAPASVFADVLGPLAANEPGSTETHALLAGSPALDAGDAATCAGVDVGGVDQRGVAREAACDIGAFEATAIAPPGPGGFVMQVVTGSASTPPFPASPVTFGVSGILGQTAVPLELLDLSLAGACSRFMPGDPCRELALVQTARCVVGQPTDPCVGGRVETRCAAFIPTDPCVQGDQALDLLVALRPHPSGGAGPVLQPATLANVTPGGFDVVYDAAGAGGRGDAADAPFRDRRGPAAPLRGRAGRRAAEPALPRDVRARAHRGCARRRPALDGRPERHGRAAAGRHDAARADRPGRRRRRRDAAGRRDGRLCRLRDRRPGSDADRGLHAVRGQPLRGRDDDRRVHGHGRRRQHDDPDVRDPRARSGRADRPPRREDARVRRPAGAAAGAGRAAESGARCRRRPPPRGGLHGARLSTRSPSGSRRRPS